MGNLHLDWFEELNNTFTRKGIHLEGTYKSPISKTRLISIDLLQFIITPVTAELNDSLTTGGPMFPVAKQTSKTLG